MAARGVTMQDVSDEFEIDGEPVDGQPVPYETVDALPVIAEVTTIERAPVTILPVAQAAVVAATGFVAGAATFALLKRRGVRRLARRAQELSDLREARDLVRSPWPALPHGCSQTYLVNVRVITPPPAE